MVCWSAIVHLTVCILLVAFRFPAHFNEAPVYYVDVVNLPVAHPQAGTPGEASPGPKSPTAPPLPASPAPREMTLPAKPAGKTPPRPATVASPKKTESAESDREFEERMAKMEQRAAAGHEAAALDALRKRVAGKGAAGMPGGTGNEAGSDYIAYLKSRLHDAFKLQSPPQTKNTEVVIHIVIDNKGRIVRRQVVKATGDKMFMTDVMLAIDIAGKNFPPPPGGRTFEHDFTFQPGGVKTK